MCSRRTCTMTNGEEAGSSAHFRAICRAEPKDASILPGMVTICLMVWADCPGARVLRGSAVSPVWTPTPRAFRFNCTMSSTYSMTPHTKGQCAVRMFKHVWGVPCYYSMDL